MWIIFLAANSKALAWTAFIILLPVALLGFTMFAAAVAPLASEAPEFIVAILSARPPCRPERAADRNRRLAAAARGRFRRSTQRSLRAGRRATMTSWPRR